MEFLTPHSETGLSAGKPRVLLLEPLFFIHTPVYIRAAMASVGFENAHFTIVTSTPAASYKEWLREFESTHENVKVHLVDGGDAPRKNRIQNLRINYSFMRAVEIILQEQTFDTITYLFVDNVLPYFSFDLFKHWFPGHFAGGVTGIIFRDNGLRPTGDRSAKARIKGALDRWVLKRAASSGAFRRLTFLDAQSADQARRRFSTDLFARGIDPIEIQSCVEENPRQRLGLPEDAHIALMFGSISDRKGVLDTLDLLNNAKFPTDGIALVLAGPIDPDIRDRVTAAMKKAEERYRVFFHEGFVKEEDVPLYFSSADCVVCAYKNFNGSSGVLLHAASFGKPVLVSDGGVMADAVRQYGFGEIVDFGQPEEFTQKMEGLLRLNREEKEKYRTAALNYARARDARLFMSQFS